MAIVHAHISEHSQRHCCTFRTDQNHFSDQAGRFLGCEIFRSGCV